MICKRIKYTDYDGVQKTKEAYFHMDKPQIIKFNRTIPGGLQGKLRSISDAKNNDELVELFEELIDASYGDKVDGEKFKKSAEILDDFKSSPAYEALYMELMENTDAALAFFKGILPADISSQIKDEDIAAKAAELTED